jgi:hypothetical protein
MVDEAIRLAESYRRVTVEHVGLESASVSQYDLILAELMHDRTDTRTAMHFLDRASEWAVTKDATEILCWAALVRADIQIHQAKRDDTTGAIEDTVAIAQHSLSEGLSIARQCGYGIYHIDLLLESARLHLLLGQPQLALDNIRVALDTGYVPRPESGMPTLIAAADPECGYAWGIAEGRHLRAQAMLLQAAQHLGRADFALAAFDKLSAQVCALIAAAREELAQCRTLRGKIQDPKIKDTQRVLDQLDKGILTEYPLTPLESKAEHGGKPDTRSMVNTFRDQVFISYSHKDKEWLHAIKTHLAPYVRNKTVDYWDDTMIKAGAKWKDEIKKALARAKVAVLLVSPNFLASDFIANNELPPLLAAAETEGLTILWIAISASSYKQTPIADYQAAHDISQPLNKLPKGDLDEALVSICEYIKAAAT